MKLAFRLTVCAFTLLMVFALWFYLAESIVLREVPAPVQVLMVMVSGFLTKESAFIVSDVWES